MEQAFLISRSRTDRKFSASEIRKWAERKNTSNRSRGGTSTGATAWLPSKVVADLLRKAAEPNPIRCPRQLHVLERQLGFGLRPGCGEGGANIRHGGDDAVVARPSTEETTVVLGRHFHVVTSALLSALRGLDGDGCISGTRSNSTVSSSRNGGPSRNRKSNNAASTERGGVVPATATAGSATPYLLSTKSIVTSLSIISPTTCSTLPPSSCRSSSSSSSSTSGQDSVSSSEDGQRYLSNQNQQQRPSRPSLQHQPQRQPPPPPRLFIAATSLTRLSSRVIEAELQSSAARASLELVTCQLSEVQRQVRDSELESATEASEHEKVRTKLAAVVSEGAIDRAKLKEVSEKQAGDGGQVVVRCCRLYEYVRFKLQDRHGG